MNRSECDQVVALIQSAWPRQPFSRETSIVYAAMLIDLEHEETLKALQRLMQENTFLPAIAEIRTAVLEKRSQLPDAQGAWMLVCLRFGPSKGRGNTNIELGPLIGTALDIAGVDAYKFHTSETRHWIKQAFVDAYSVLRRDALEVENDPRLQEPEGQKRLNERNA